MMSRGLGVVVGLLWFFLVFLVAFRITFPSDTLKSRAIWEVREVSDGALLLDIGKVSPWWVGLKAKDVRLYAADPSGEGHPEGILQMDVARVRVAPFSILGSPRVLGGLRLGDGDLAFSTVLQREGGQYGLADLKVDGSKFPLSAIPPIQGTRIKGTGALDVSVDLITKEGMRKAEGSLTLYGRDLTVEELTGAGAALAMFDVLPIYIEELDLRVEVTQGKAQVVRGKLVSSLADIDLSGDVTLQDDLARSRFRLKAVLDLSEEAAQFAGLMRSAQWSDERYHWVLAGVWPRIVPRPDRERRASTVRPTGAQPEYDTEEQPKVAAPETLEAVREAREKKREERAARLKERRQGVADDPRRLTGPAINRPIEAARGDDLEILDDEEPLDGEIGDDELLDEEGLPPEGLEEDLPLEGEELPPEDF